MSIYKKIAEMQQELLKEQFKTKKGFHGKYIPLPEMLPPILKQCFEKELTLYFTSTTEHLILKLMSWDGKDEFSDRVRLPELGKDEKDEGKKITYLKRYLLMNTFMILEESVDPDDEPVNDVNSAETVKNTSSSNNTKPSKKKEDEVKEVPIGKLTLEARDKLVKGGIDENEITPQILKQKILHLQKWTVPERRYIINYFKEQKEKDLGGSK